ncbi:MAG: hypothetical protein ACI8Y4_003750 [Candidatus Poriferisodalaceae bacterium]|jgi:hypothetical protein
MQVAGPWGSQLAPETVARDEVLSDSFSCTARLTLLAYYWRCSYVAWHMQVPQLRSALNPGGFRSTMTLILVALVAVFALVLGLIVSEILVDVALRGGR